MTRTWIVVAVALVAGACTKGPASPTGPSAAPPPAPVRVIALTGSLAFGEVWLGDSRDAVFRISNTGTDALVVTGLTGPSGYAASWTSGAIAAGAFQDVTVRFTPAAPRTYNGTLTVNANHTSGVNTMPISGTGLAELFARSGTGNTVFDMPAWVERVRIVGRYTGSSSNFIVRVGGRLVVNELVGTFWNQTVYDGIHLVTGGIVEITNSSGVAWSFTEVRAGS